MPRPRSPSPAEADYCVDNTVNDVSPLVQEVHREMRQLQDKSIDSSVSFGAKSIDGSVSFGPKSIDSSVSFGDTVIESSESFETKSIDSSVSFVLQQESYMNLKVNASRYALSHRC